MVIFRKEPVMYWDLGCEISMWLYKSHIEINFFNVMENIEEIIGDIMVGNATICIKVIDLYKDEFCKSQNDCYEFIHNKLYEMISENYTQIMEVFNHEG